MKRKISDFLPTFMVAGALIMLIVAIVPLVIVSLYSHPCADDYTYGLLSHKVWVDSHSIIETIKQAFLQVKSSYYTWQGTHASIFFMALSPAVFEGSVSYGLSAWIMITVLIVSVISISDAFFVTIFGAKKWMSYFVALVTAFWMLESMYSPVNGLFWFNGSVHYWFMHGCMLICLSNILKVVGEGKNKNRAIIKVLHIIFASFFAFLCGGANYSTALLTGCILGLCVLLGFVLYKTFLMVIPLGVYIVSFAISALAPGNSIRGGYFEGKGPVEAIFEALKLTIYDDTHWIDLQLWIILLMILPVLYIMAKKTDFTKIRWLPIVSILISFGLHASLNVPLFFAMGGAGVARQENICKLWFQLMVVMNSFLIVCAIRPMIDCGVEKLSSKIHDKRGVKLAVITLLFYLGMALSIGVHMKLSDRSIFQYSSYIAYVEIRNGEATDFYSTYEERLKILEKEKGDVVLPEYSVRPYLLYMDDIESSVTDWKNTAFAKWYDVHSVTK